MTRPFRVSRPTLVSTNTVMDVLGISRQKVFDLMERGELEEKRIGTSRLVYLDSLERYVGREVVLLPNEKKPRRRVPA